MCVMLFEKCIQNRTLACVDAILRGSIYERASNSFFTHNEDFVNNMEMGGVGGGKSVDQKFCCCCLSVENVQ